MNASTSFREIAFKIAVLITLVVIILYQVSLDKKLTNLQGAAERATSSAKQAS